MVSLNQLLKESDAISLHTTHEDANKGIISGAEIEKMKQEAEKHKDKDQKEKEKIEAKNTADTTIYSAEKAVKDAGDKLDENIKKEVESSIKELREIAEKGTKEEIEEKITALSQLIQKVSQAQSTDKKKEATDNKNEKEKPLDKDDVEEGEVVE